MNVHEYQAKELFRQFGVPVPEGTAADTPERARAIADSLKTDFYVVKAQIHSGGRGKAGGVKLVNTPAEVEQAARDLIGRTLVTHQTGPAGKQVRTVSVDIAYKPERELYVSILVDRGTSRPTFLVSTEGGMDIEQVAASTPEKIMREPIDPAIGMQPYQARKLAYALGLGGEFLKPTVKLLQALYQSFMATDASLIEVNPLIVTDTGAVLALDAKMNFDDNALFRHQDILDLRDVHEEDPREVEASKHNLSYIGLEGNIGCMVNGAGLAMATMDTIKTCGGEPANFLDVGGGATTEQVTEAFKILCGDPNVKAILVNIFGGIMKCDVIAAGILTAAREVGVSVPLVVRLEGTNVKEGKEALAASDLAIIAADSMADAGRKVVDAAA